MRCEQRAEGLEIQPPLGVEQPQAALELAAGGGVFEDPDLLDQPVEPQTDRRVADAVGLGGLLERARGEQETAEEGEVLVAQGVGPAGFRSGMVEFFVIGLSFY